jgi:hypothetical protein
MDQEEMGREGKEEADNSFCNKHPLQMKRLPVCEELFAT